MKVSFSQTNNPADATAIPVESSVSTQDIDQNGAVDITPAEVIPCAPVCNAVATVPAVAVPAATPTDSPIEFDDNDVQFSDIYLPRVNIVQRVGDLSLVYNPGEIVLNQTLVIHTPANPDKKVVGDPPLNITVIGFKRKQFAEKVVGGASGLLVNTEQEVVKHGGTLSYKEWEQSVEAAKTNPAALRKYFQPFSTALLLIERPTALKDEGDIQFPYECEGRHYALALWGTKGTSYTHATKHFFTQRKIGFLRKGYSVRAWSLTTKTEKFGANFAEIPVVRPGEVNSQAFLDFVNAVIGGA